MKLQRPDLPIWLRGIVAMELPVNNGYLIPLPHRHCHGAVNGRATDGAVNSLLVDLPDL